jgi:hypothetical protein
MCASGKGWGEKGEFRQLEFCEYTLGLYKNFVEEQNFCFTMEKAGEKVCGGRVKMTLVRSRASRRRHFFLDITF